MLNALALPRLRHVTRLEVWTPRTAERVRATLRVDGRLDAGQTPVVDEGLAVPCPSCGTPNPGGFRFCGSCGHALERLCPACGAAVADGFRFCGNCGAPIDPGRQTGPARVSAGEERKVVSVVFADLEASTQLATRLDPEDLREVYASYFQEMAAQIELFGGFVEKFIGDAVVGIFGAPVAHDDDPERAIRAALAMQRRVPDLNRGLGPKLGAEIAMRVAVHTGEVLASPGAEKEGLVTGEAMNIASRMQGIAPIGGVVVSQRTQRDTQRVFQFAPLGDVALKGIDSTVPIWQVVGERRSETSVAGPPLVGRRDELDLLSVLLRRCVRERAPYVVTIVGSAGIGKTRLATEFATSIRHAGASEPDAACRVVRGRCLAYGDGLLLWPLAEILKADAGILDSDSPQTFLHKTTQTLDARYADDSAAMATTSTLLSSLGVAMDSDPLAGVGRSAAERMIAEAWAHYLDGLAGTGSVLALIEDLHWADTALLELLERLASVSQAPVLFVCLARPEIFDRRPNWGAGNPNFATISLSPLSTTEGATLIENLLEREAAPELVAAIVNRAEGNPFFATELLHMLHDYGAIRPGDDGWSLTDVLPNELPDTVQGVITARLDRLAAAEKRAIQDASVVGRVFWDGALEALGGDAVVSAVDALLARGLIRLHAASAFAGSRELTFDHALICDVAYGSIPRARRRQAHALVLDWIENATRGRDEEFAEILAHHAIQSRDAARTARYSTLAGHRHRRVYAAEEAIHWYERALAAAEDPDARTSTLLLAEILHGRGDTYEQIGRLAEAAADYEREAEIGRGSDRQWLVPHALTSLSHILLLQDEYARAEELLPEALQRARDAGTADLEARIVYTAGALAWARGEWQRALEQHRQALDVAHAAEDLEGEAYARQGLADTLNFSGPLVEALEQCTIALALWRKLGQKPRVYQSALRLAFIYLLLGRFIEAEQSVAEALVGLRDLGQHPDEAATLSARALAELFHAELETALTSADEAVEGARDVTAPRPELVALVTRLVISVEARLVPAVRADVLTARVLSRKLDSFLGPVITAAEGWLAVVAGDSATATRLFDQARHASGDGLLYQLLCGRLEISGWELAGEAPKIRSAGEWLLERSRNESPPHEALGAWAIAAADELEKRLQPETARVVLDLAIASGDITVVRRARSLVRETPPAGHGRTSGPPGEKAFTESA